MYRRSGAREAESFFSSMTSDSEEKLKCDDTREVVSVESEAAPTKGSGWRGGGSNRIGSLVPTNDWKRGEEERK